VLSSRGWAAWLKTGADGATFALGEEVELSTRAAGGPLRLHLFCASTPAARVRAFLRACGGLLALLPEWAWWRSGDPAAGVRRSAAPPATGVSRRRGPRARR
jgi:hypothetical protein